MQATAIMYHALYDGESEWLALQPEERPYAVSISDFRQQLDALEQAGVRILNPRSLLSQPQGEENNPAVLLTFDDGHASFYRHAYPILMERQYRGVFFITTDLIEKRDDFCDWHQLAEMARDGHLIQAHGKSHSFLPELDDVTAELELKQSRQKLQTETGQPVFCMSFPGGRYTRRDISLGRKHGYKAFFTSSIGLMPELPLRETTVISRIPVRAGMSLSSFVALASGRVMSIKTRQLAYKMKYLLKSLLGDQLYHVIYKRIFS